MPKVIPPIKDVEPTPLRWIDDVGKHLIKCVTLEIGDNIVAKTVYCEHCHEAFDAPVSVAGGRFSDFEAEWQKIYRESDKPDFDLCPECDRKSNSEKRKCPKI